MFSDHLKTCSYCRARTYQKQQHEKLLAAGNTRAASSTTNQKMIELIHIIKGITPPKTPRVTKGASARSGPTCCMHPKYHDAVLSSHFYQVCILLPLRYAMLLLVCQILEK